VVDPHSSQRPIAGAATPRHQSSYCCAVVAGPRRTGELRCGVLALGPTKRRDRIERTLRWHYQNVRDHHIALDGRVELKSTREQQFAKLDVVARRNNLEPKALRGGYTNTEAVTYRETRLGAAVPLGSSCPGGSARGWRMAARGRTWVP
jgi:hypothetical protein